MRLVTAQAKVGNGAQIEVEQAIGFLLNKITAPLMKAGRVGCLYGLPYSFRKIFERLFVGWLGVSCLLHCRQPAFGTLEPVFIMRTKPLCGYGNIGAGVTVDVLPG